MLSYDDLKRRPAAFLAATSLTCEEYELLLEAFTSAYARHYPADQTMDGAPRKRSVGAGVKGTLSTFCHKLLFILIYFKTSPLQTLHGLHFDLSQSQTNYWIHRLLPVLHEALRESGHAPEREARAVQTSALAREGGADLLLDGTERHRAAPSGTERRRARPCDKTPQKEHYSGKKKAHTDKNLVVVNQNSGKIAYLSPTVAGKKHDKKMADEAEIAYPAGAVVSKDSGFQGYEPPGVFTLQPKKNRAHAS